MKHLNLHTLCDVSYETERNIFNPNYYPFNVNYSLRITCYYMSIVCLQA